jgi:hypothetical protein
MPTSVDSIRQVSDTRQFANSEVLYSEANAISQPKSLEAGAANPFQVFATNTPQSNKVPFAEVAVVVACLVAVYFFLVK